MELRVRIAAALADGVSMRGVERLTGVTRKTVGAFLLALGEGAARVQSSLLHGLHCDLIECDEVWAYVGCKEAHRDDLDPAEFGDAYTFVAIDATSRAVISHLTDKRSEAATETFARDLRARVLGAPQITTDGFQFYRSAIEAAFGARVQYAQILKTYYDERESDDAPREDVRYARRRVVRSVKRTVTGVIDETKVSTSYVERSNLTTRMWVRRLARLTTCFSRRLVFLRAAMSLHFAVYNFVRVHAALRITPAMQLGVTDHVWSMEELVVAALRAVRDVPPQFPPPTPPTQGIVPAVQARAARRRAARRAAATGTDTPLAPSTRPSAAGRPSLAQPDATVEDYRWMW